MSKIVDHEAEFVRAATSGKIEGGFRWGSVNGHRTYGPIHSTSRRRCNCGCGNRATHNGYGDGLALTSGCELSMRRWVRDGFSAFRSSENT